jgi:ABC-type polysaccharide/polyol phosphate export permease
VNIAQLFSKKELIYILVKKALKEKHVGSILGYFWSFYTALFPLFSYVFVFFFIAKIKVPGVEGPWEYLTYVFSGLLPWLFFNNVITESVDALNSNLDLLRQAIFPVEIISLVSATQNLFNFLLQTVLLILVVMFFGLISIQKILLLPVFCVLLYMFCVGLGWILSILGFFLRDLKDILTTLIRFLIYLTPIMYARENVPPKVWFIFIANPMTHAINFFRDILYYKNVEAPSSIVIFGVISLITFMIGYVSILSVKKTIGDMV